jgi:hypothetical protein
MADQNHFERSINAASAGAQALDADGNIAPTTTVVTVDSTSGDVSVLLPAQLAAAGAQITVVKTVAANNVIVKPQTGESLGGVVDNTDTLATGTAYLVGVYASTGSSWAKVV